MYVVPTGRHKAVGSQDKEGSAHAYEHTAADCSTLQHAATHCRTLQRTAAHCRIQPHTTTHCHTLSPLSTCHKAVGCQGDKVNRHFYKHTATHCNTLQRTAAHCSTLRHTSAHTANAVSLS